MKKRQNAVILSTLSLIAVLGSCATTRQSAAPDERMQTLDTRTVLDVPKPKVAEIEARILLGAGGTLLTPDEAAQLSNFADDFAKLGRGNLVVSYPIGAPNDAAAQTLVREIQMRLYSSGVEISKMGFGPYQASNTAPAPVILAFNRYEVAPLQCKPWTEIDPKKTANNLPTERFGCAQRANLAAMVLDPGDLVGDRKDEPRDAARAQVGIDLHRKGELKQVSGAVAGGTN